MFDILKRKIPLMGDFSMSQLMVLHVHFLCIKKGVLSAHPKNAPSIDTTQIEYKKTRALK